MKFPEYRYERGCKAVEGGNRDQNVTHRLFYSAGCGEYSAQSAIHSLIEAVRPMLRILAYIAILAIPPLAVSGYALFVLVASAPISELSVEKAGQFGDSFGIVTCLFSGLAFSGVLITLLLQRDELKMQREEIERSAKEHALNKRLTALSSLLGVYQALADKKQEELDKHHLRIVPGETGAVSEMLEAEIDGIRRTRDKIFDALEGAAELK